jgi:glycerophosphoryl diester phosphodiesterase
MLDASLKILSQDPDGFFVVLEEEGTDNFGNNNNAAGTIEGVRRADAAIGVAMNYVNTKDPNTLVLTAADSDAGGLQVFQFEPYTRPSGNSTSNPTLANTEPSAPFIGVNPTTTNSNRAVLDGSNGSTGTAEAPWKPFAAQSSIDGPMGNFGVAWVGTPDFPGSIVSKAYGMNADKLPSTLDNTEIYDLMYQTMFGISPELAAANQVAEVVSGSTGVDTLVAGATPAFDGINDIVFTGAGNDVVDAAMAGSAARNNRIDTGSGDDTIDVANGDRVFGGEGNDEIFAQGISGFRISGGAGNDTFQLGGSTGGRALGGDGDDKFFANSGGGNLLSGGAGADIFNIFSGDVLSAANIILDFQMGTDKIQIGGGITSLAGLTLTGSDIIVKSTSAAIATLTGITTSTLTASDFMF